MRTEKAVEQSSWYSLPLHQNPRAIIPLYLAGLGSLCWETAALWEPASSLQMQIWIALIIVGFVSMPLGFIGGIVYRHYEVAAFAVILGLISPPMWFWLFFTLHPIFGPEKPNGFPVVLWFYFQIPLALIALWRSPWRKRAKMTMTPLAAAGLICLFTIHTVRTRHEVEIAPHVSAEYLSSVYQKNNTSAIKRLNNKRIVVTGVIGGQDEGLFGGGPPTMQGDSIEFDDLDTWNSVADGQKAAIIGTCKGKDTQGRIHLTDCRLVE